MRKSAIAILILGIGLIAWWNQKNPIKQQAPTPPPVTGPEDITEPPTETPFPGDKILKDYGSDDSSPKNDLRLISRLIDSAFLIVKNRDTREYATNEDLVLFLQGQNSYQSAYLGRSSPALNDVGQLIDRWGSPLIVHPLSQKILELRSAGPDQKPYTEDDLTWPEITRR